MYEVTRVNERKDKSSNVPCETVAKYMVKVKDTGQYVIVQDSNDNDTDRLTKKQYLDLITSHFTPTNFRGLP